MTLEEAIEILAATEWVTDYDPECPVSAAATLGLEALKAHKTRREDPKGNWSYLLPGETEE